MEAMSPTGVIFQNFLWICTHLWWDIFSFLYIFCLIWSIAKLTTNSFSSYFQNFCSETLQPLPSKSGEFISLFFESGFRHVTDFGQWDIRKPKSLDKCLSTGAFPLLLFLEIMTATL